MVRVNSTNKETASNFSPDNGTGLQVRTAIKDVLEALRTVNSGFGDPSGATNTTGYQMHIDTTNESSGESLLKIKHPTNTGFVEIGNVLDTNLGLLPKAGGTMTGQLKVDDGGTAIAPAIGFDNDTDTGLFRSAANELAISTAGTERWTFLSDGSLTTRGTSINTALTTAGAAFFFNNNKFNGLALVKDDIGWGTPLFIKRLNPYATGNLVEFFSHNTFCGAINTTTGTTTNFNTNVSDRTLKKNFESWDENTLDLFKNLNPQKYNYISEDNTAEKNKGFIAQELVDSFPEAYPQNDKGKYMFNPSGMVVYLMKALQESVAKIETLEAKVAALEAK
tara:strand:- start:176 stop:1183 length:1008 start_codon:yes stop_codon:yes gene_type:complete